VQLLRKAFSETMEDENLLGEAHKANIDINPVGGEELAKSVEGVLQLESGLWGTEGDFEMTRPQLYASRTIIGAYSVGSYR
jgi:hypothetical protein